MLFALCFDLLLVITYYLSLGITCHLLVAFNSWWSLETDFTVSFIMDTVWFKASYQKSS